LRRIEMRSTILDPTAGKRARRIRTHPERPERVSDPMDSRFGEVTPSVPAIAVNPRPIVDPMDPECGESRL
jgi:hypothetical protein